MDNYFTDELIEELTTNYDWELVPSRDGKFKLRQKDSHHMTTSDFYATD